MPASSFVTAVTAVFPTADHCGVNTPAINMDEARGILCAPRVDVREPDNTFGPIVLLARVRSQLQDLVGSLPIP